MARKNRNALGAPRSYSPSRRKKRTLPGPQHARFCNCRSCRTRHYYERGAVS